MPQQRKNKKCRATRKLCYTTEQDAKDQLAIINMLGPIWRKEQRVYQCRHCQHWHLTSQRPRAVMMFDDSILSK
jgi:hypothetical protein